MVVVEITRVRVDGYKCIQSLDLTIPSRLAVFVGKNNSGKSTIFDVLNLLSRHASTDTVELRQDLGQQQREEFQRFRHKKQITSPCSIHIDFLADDDMRRRFVSMLFESQSP